MITKGTVWKRGRCFLLAAAIMATSTLVNAEAPDTFLELDGNSTVDGVACTAPNTPSGCADDWNLLNGNGTNGGSAGGSLVRSFVSGSASVAVFTTGGSKDPLDVTNWKWKGGGTPDKDAITNVYAAAYQSPANHLILEFGADRFAVNGDANIGLWFFQQDVHPVGSTSGGFSGAHSVNDIFIVSSFTQGGGISTITVYTWDPTCAKGVNNPTAGQCADSNLRLKFASVPSSSCDNVQEGCAIVNGAAIDVSWAYLSKFGNGSTQIPEGGFFEGGLDVTQLLGSALPCFTTFLMETRSSQATSAVLKDFVAGSLPVCSLGSSKTCAGDGVLNAGGTSIHYAFNGTAVNTGIGALSNVTVVDTLPAGSSNVVFKKGSTTPPSTTVSASTCPAGAPSNAVCANLGSLAAGATEYWSVEFDSTSLNVQNNEFAAAASSGSPGACSDSGTICSTSHQDSCTAVPTNSITISKVCGVPSGYPNATLPGTQLITTGNPAVAAVRVNFSGDITNSGQTPLSNITLTDDPSATITVTWPDSTKPGVLAAGASAKYSGNYLPSGVTAGDLGGAAGRYSFNDNIKVTGATAALGSSPGHDATCVGTFNGNAQACGAATCNICPAGATCSGN